MNFQPIDLTTIVVVAFSMSIFIIPILGWTLRATVKPMLEAYAKAFPQGAQMQLEIERLTRRVQELEDERPAQRSLNAASDHAVDVLQLPR